VSGFISVQHSIALFQRCKVIKLDDLQHTPIDATAIARICLFHRFLLILPVDSLVNYTRVLHYPRSLTFCTSFTVFIKCMSPANYA